MKKHLGIQLTFSSVATVLASSLIYLEPAQAASFTIFLDYQNSNVYGNLQGKLDFDFAKTTLTGIGLEKASLSQLPEAKFEFKYSHPTPAFADKDFSNFDLSEPTFYFDSGILIGMDIDGESGSILWPDRFPKNYLGDYREFFGDINFYIRKNQLIEIVDGSVSYLIIATDRNGDLLGGNLLGSSDENYQTEGQVIFEVVPEPVTLLGAATAIGFSVFFKRKSSKNSQTKP